jgi:hypothetical protein
VEITSKPEPKTITVTDIDIRFPGETKEITLYPDDTIDESDMEYRIARITLKGVQIAEGIKTPDEIVTIHLDHVLWIARRTRTVTLPPDQSDAPHRPA